MNSSQEETFQALTDYFAGRGMRILTSNSPSYIRVEFGSWGSFSLSNSKGEAEVSVTKRNGGSYISFNFSFFKDYLADFLVAIIGALILYGFLQWLWSLSFSPSDIDSKIAVNLFSFGMITLLFAFTLGVAGYSTSLTRKRFIGEFNVFAQSLPPKK